MFVIHDRYVLHETQLNIDNDKIREIENNSNNTVALSLGSEQSVDKKFDGCKIQLTLHLIVT